MEDIYRRPWIGFGYGGLERAFVYAGRASYDAAQVEIDVVSGTLHNGYLAGARALGVPALGLFLVIFVGRIFSSASLALRLRETDPDRSELHCLSFAHLSAFVVALYIGHDLNTPLVWFYLFLGVLVERLHAREAAFAAPASPTPVLVTPQPVVG